ncbi:MAG: hypothetical protein IKL06_01335 [Lachnospiraceae bacterium]|nr:hypothetical protein [Lachnospiraceae bacterium]
MLRKVWLDYLEGFRWSKIRAFYNFNRAWIFIYMLTMLPFIVQNNHEESVLVEYYLTVIPLLLGMHTMAIIPLRLPKQMYLCPMGMRERQQYLKQMFWLRLMMPVLFGMVLFTIGVMAERFDWLYVGKQVFGLLSIMISGSITYFPGSVMDRDNDKEKEHFTDKRLKGLKTIGMIGQVTSLIYVVLLIFFMTTLRWVRILNDILALPILIADIWTLRYLPTILELNVDYENAYEVLKEQKA